MEISSGCLTPFWPFNSWVLIFGSCHFQIPFASTNAFSWKIILFIPHCRAVLVDIGIEYSVTTMQRLHVTQQCIYKSIDTA